MTMNEKSKAVVLALARLARSSTLSINELRIVLALERIVARIEAHKILRDKLVFKGGFVLLKTLDSRRFTRDLDALAANMPRNKILESVKEAIRIDLDDGLYFAEPEVEDLTDQGQYGGYRVRVPFQIGPLPKELRKLKKLSRVHLDVGFGDVIAGRVKRSRLSPVIEGEKAVSWKIYPIESIYAEKLETLISRGSANSRAKDLYDLVLISDEARMGTRLVSAVRKTFSNRETAIPNSFAEFFDLLDLTILERSWGSVELSGADMLFANCVRKLRAVLKKVDRLLEGKSNR